ncbi:uncharacterized protein LOC126567374 [Anopheles maculipalpis]|uniref:uncharacterized protein LOC126567374 n=1 Tax=Anopheles maculipalpis TaxID=1496333 RepID=UPI0021593FC5|nr:uncharacterized protein LOC126567374 [Anopheles maculipalpis]
MAMLKHDGPIGRLIPPIPTIIQWNCRSLLGKLDSFKALVGEHNCDVFALCETWLSEDINLTFPGYNIIREDRITRGGGVLIGVRKSHTFTRIPTPRQDIIETVAVKAKLGDLHVTITSIYIPPIANNEKEKIEKFKEDLGNLAVVLPGPLLILGDFNSHGVDWGCDKDDIRAPIIRDICDRFGFSILNSGEATRMQTPKSRASALDLSLCPSAMALDFSWKVIQDPIGSDHLPIEISYIKGGCPVGGIPVKCDLTRNIDWTRYGELVAASLSLDLEDLSPVQEYEKLVSIINKCALEAQTRRSHQARTFKKPPTPWWDKDCQAAFNKKREAFKAKIKEEMPY